MNKILLIEKTSSQILFFHKFQNNHENSHIFVLNTFVFFNILFGDIFSKKGKKIIKIVS
jgi:hypothetical protein